MFQGFGWRPNGLIFVRIDGDSPESMLEWTACASRDGIYALRCLP